LAQKRDGWANITNSNAVDDGPTVIVYWGVVYTFTKLNISLNEHGGNGENYVFKQFHCLLLVLGTHCDVFAT